MAAKLDAPFMVAPKGDSAGKLETGNQPAGD
jgi:hypothetical protein